MSSVDSNNDKIIASEVGIILEALLSTVAHEVTSTKNANGLSKKNTSTYDSFDFEEPEGASPSSKVTLVLKDRSKRRCLIQTSPVAKRIKFTRPNVVSKVGYIYSSSLLEQVDRIPKVKGRASMVHELIAAYGLLNSPNLLVISSRPAYQSQLLSFHTESYIENLMLTEKSSCPDVGGDADDSCILDSSNLEEFGLAYDCPAMNNMYTFVREVVGSTLTALNALHLGHVSTAINWFGGWHHGKKDEASGFCYANDIVIGILWLLKQGYRKVLYVDFDLHHGDAVEDAFAHTDKVFTLSFHKYEPGFFPSTGSLNDIGYGKGKGYCLNIPLKDGIRDENYLLVACHTLKKVLAFYKPEIIISQFGADCITGDPMIGFSLTPESLKVCLTILMDCNLPLLLLGGGGYNPVNVARTWTILTAHVLKCNLDSKIPDNLYFLSYGPGFELEIQAGTKKDQNEAHFLHSITNFVDSQLKLE